jgi:DNA polymerase-4
VVVEVVERVTRRMRKAERLGRTVTLRLRFDDFTRVTRSHTLDQPAADTKTILAIARGLLATAMPMIRARGCTLVGLSVGNLDDDGLAQLKLPFDRGVGVLDAAVDSVRDKYGSSALQRAVLLGKRPGITVPLLPD